MTPPVTTLTKEIDLVRGGCRPELGCLCGVDAELTLLTIQRWDGAYGAKYVDEIIDWICCLGTPKPPGPTCNCPECRCPPEKQCPTCQPTKCPECKCPPPTQECQAQTYPKPENT